MMTGWTNKMDGKAVREKGGQKIKGGKEIIFLIISGGPCTSSSRNIWLPW